MKRFIIKTIVLLLVSITMVNIVMLYDKDDRSLHSFERNAALAFNRLQALKDTNKIVIIAGSNGGFSINSRMISNAFQMPVVNTCTHAGIGVRMQFEMYKEFLRRGDIVIFCPEYGGGKKRLYGESTLFRILSSHMPSAYSKISLQQWLFVYKYIGVNYIEVLKHKGTKELDGPYSAKALNEYGDIEYERSHQDSIALYNLGGTIDEDVIAYYKYIHSYAEEGGIRLIFLPPTFIESNYNKNSKQIDSIADCLRRNGIAYQSPPSKYCFPDSLYYDTPYHMTQSGANKRTEVLIEDIRRFIEIQKISGTDT